MGGVSNPAHLALEDKISEHLCGHFHWTPTDVEGYAEMAGSDGFFEKPLDPGALLNRLTELLGE